MPDPSDLSAGGDHTGKVAPPAESPREPSEVIGPTDLDQALLLVVVRRDGSTYVATGSDANLPVLAGFLQELIRHLEEHDAADECATCRAAGG